MDDGMNGILTEENVEQFAQKVTDFMNKRNTEQGVGYRRMSENAYQKAVLYKEEAVALKAVNYYNNVIAEKATQKKHGMRGAVYGSEISYFGS